VPLAHDDYKDEKCEQWSINHPSMRAGRGFWCLCAGRALAQTQARLAQYGDWCGSCNAPQMVLPTGEHVCQSHVESWLYHQWQQAQEEITRLEEQLEEKEDEIQQANGW